jgi:hypothetical protein
MAPEFIEADHGGIVRLIVLVDDYWHSVADTDKAALRMKLSAIRQLAAKYGSLPKTAGDSAGSWSAARTRRRDVAGRPRRHARGRQRGRPGLACRPRRRVLGARGRRIALAAASVAYG